MKYPLLSVLLLSGCAAVPQADQEETNKAKQFITPQNGNASVYIYESRGTDLVSSNNIYVDDKCVGQVNYSSFVQFELPAGDYVFGMESYQDANEIDVTLEANSIKIIKAHSAAGFSYFLTQVEDNDYSKAMDIIKKLPLAKAYECRK